MADFESWDIAGYGGGGDWLDVEGEGALPLDDDVEIPDWVDEMVVHFITDSGDDVYVTIWGPWDDWDVLYDLIDDIDVDAYGADHA